MVCHKGVFHAPFREKMLTALLGELALRRSPLVPAASAGSRVWQLPDHSAPTSPPGVLTRPHGNDHAI